MSDPRTYTTKELLLVVRQENHRLRMLLCEVLKSLGNGAGASPECSLDFLASIPEEVRLEVARLRASGVDLPHGGGRS